MKKEYVTVVIEVPDHTKVFFDVVKLENNIFGGKIVAMGRGDEITKLEKIEEWFVNNHVHNDEIMSILNS